MRTLGETSEIEGVFSATGGALASTALSRFLLALDTLDIQDENVRLESALLVPRLHASNQPDIVYVESEFADEILSGSDDVWAYSKIVSVNSDGTSSACECYPLPRRSC